MNSYGFKFKEIKSFGSDIELGKLHYRFEGINFMFNYKKPKGKLIVFFHGAKQNTTPLPIFRGFNYELEGINILSLSDKLLEIYEKINIGWFLSTKKYDFKLLYLRIIKNIIRKLETTDVLFFGTSAGGFPAYYFASLLQQKCLISNSQLFVEKYPLYKSIQNVLKKEGDSFNIPNMKSLMLKNYKPVKMVLFVNKNDTHHYEDHALPFVNIAKEHKIQIKFYPFDGILNKDNTNKKITHHHIQFTQDLNELLIKT